VDALKSARGNRAKAARLLGSTERIIGYKVRKYGIDPGRFRGGRWWRPCLSAGSRWAGRFGAAASPEGLILVTGISSSGPEERSFAAALAGSSERILEVGRASRVAGSTG